MITQTLDGCQYNWKIANHKNNDQNCSKLHLRARDIIKSIYPTVILLEEVPIKIDKLCTLYLDFYLPLYKIAIEVNGAQHYKYIKYYHYHPSSFLKQQQNYTNKQEWCELNNIRLITLSYENKDVEWRKQFCAGSTNC